MRRARIYESKKGICTHTESPFTTMLSTQSRSAAFRINQACLPALSFASKIKGMVFPSSRISSARHEPEGKDDCAWRELIRIQEIKTPTSFCIRECRKAVLKEFLKPSILNILHLLTGPCFVRLAKRYRSCCKTNACTWLDIMPI